MHNYWENRQNIMKKHYFNKLVPGFMIQICVLFWYKLEILTVKKTSNPITSMP